ncbi:MAG: lipase, partial [Acutalibacteraceae bacterium]|nr:lipase [Acutalibacteraceae bacterium]
MERNNQYPIILVHGFMGYGDEDGVSRFLSGWGFGPGKNAVRHLHKNGFECYGPAVGPINNLWDRSCELYYRLVGGTVDYGKYHSEKYG